MLPQDKLNMLIGVLLGDEDKALVTDYDGDTTVITTVDRFFYTIYKVPRLERRLKAARLRFTFDGIANDIRARHRVVLAAFNAVNNSSSLRATLEHVLAIGNFLNGGTNRGGAYGFKLDSLTKLSTVKSADNSMTLIHYLAMCASTSTGLTKGLNRLPDVCGCRGS